MKKYFKTKHYKSKDGKFDIYINFYTTKGGFLKFNVKIYVDDFQIANYNTSGNEMLKFLKRCEYFNELEG